MIIELTINFGYSTLLDMKKILMLSSLVLMVSFAFAQQQTYARYMQSPRAVAIPADAVSVAFARSQQEIKLLNYPQNTNELMEAKDIIDALLPAIATYNEVREKYLTAAQVAGTLIATHPFSAKNKTFYVQDFLEEFAVFMPVEIANTLMSFRNNILDDKLVIETEKQAVLEAYLNTYSQRNKKTEP